MLYSQIEEFEILLRKSVKQILLSPIGMFNFYRINVGNMRNAVAVNIIIIVSSILKSAVLLI